MQLQRTHYHDFMLDVHGRLRHFQKQADPLALVADEIVDSTNVRCAPSCLLVIVLCGIRELESCYPRGAADGTSRL